MSRDIPGGDTSQLVRQIQSNLPQAEAFVQVLRPAACPLRTNAKSRIGGTAECR